MKVHDDLAAETGPLADSYSGLYVLDPTNGHACDNGNSGCKSSCMHVDDCIECLWPQHVNALMAVGGIGKMQ